MVKMRALLIDLVIVEGNRLSRVSQREATVLQLSKGPRRRKNLLSRFGVGNLDHFDHANFKLTAQQPKSSARTPATASAESVPDTEAEADTEPASFLHSTSFLAPSASRSSMPEDNYRSATSSLLERVEQQSENSKGRKESESEKKKREDAVGVVPPEGGKMQWYCPGVEDWTVYGDKTTVVPSKDPGNWGAGWTMGGGGGLGVVSNHWTLDLLGGEVWIDGIDTTQVLDGVNTNLYTTSPSDFVGTGFSNPGGINACDSGKGVGMPNKCMEMDIFEGTGSQGYCTTWHDEHEQENNNPEGKCSPPDQGGYKCQKGRLLDEQDKGAGVFALKYTVSEEGCPASYHVHASRNGYTADTEFQQAVKMQDQAVFTCETAKKVYRERGALFRSTMWTGWCCDKFSPDGKNPDSSKLGKVRPGGGGVVPTKYTGNGDNSFETRSTFSIRGFKALGRLNSKSTNPPALCRDQTGASNAAPPSPAVEPASSAASPAAFPTPPASETHVEVRRMPSAPLFSNPAAAPPRSRVASAAASAEAKAVIQRACSAEENPPVTNAWILETAQALINAARGEPGIAPGTGPIATRPDVIAAAQAVLLAVGHARAEADL